MHRCCMTRTWWLHQTGSLNNSWIGDWSEFSRGSIGRYSELPVKPDRRNWLCWKRNRWHRLISSVGRSLKHTK